MANQLLEKLESEFPKTEQNMFHLIDVKKTEYFSCVPEIIKSLPNKKTCIISIPREGQKILTELKKKKIETKNILVLSGIKADETNPQIKVFEPQWDLNALKNSISFAVKNFQADFFVFDSVNILNLFLEQKELIEFMQKFISILKQRNMQAVFVSIADELPDQTAVRIEGLMDQRISLEKFLGKKIKIQQKKPKKQVIKQPTKKQAVNVKELKKSISQIIREEAKKIAEETKKNLELKHEKELKEKPKKTKPKQKPVHKLEKEKEKLRLQRKLELLQKSLELEVISQKAFDEGKRQIQEKMRKI